jgi:5-methylcytosine-specific restriction endonuclease McrA
MQIKLDPGSKTTGIALVHKTKSGGVSVLNLFDLVHRGRQISEALTARRQMRRRRRAKLRYRAPRFLNRGNKAKGWLAPSLRHRVDTTKAWVDRLSRWAPVSALSMELVRFDMQQIENPEISGVEYCQGTLAGFEQREYLLEKWGRKCAYCDAKDVPLNLDHIHSRANGGSNRVSNMTLACIPCNQKKGSMDIKVFLAKQPGRLQHILQRTKAPLKDASSVNSTKKALCETLRETGLPLETSTGGRTKWNRSRFGIPKTHALDAVCVGAVESVSCWQKPTLVIKATGRGCYQRTRLTANGFPRGYLTRTKQIKGFQTGDIARAVVPTGKKAGTFVGRIAVRTTGSFNIQTPCGVIQGISHRHCKLVQRGDGYSYQSSLQGVQCIS